jgi:hypothetical protein
MTVVIDDVYAEVDDSRGGPPPSETAQAPCESSNLQDRDSEKSLADQIHRLEVRQLRLMAD